MLSEKLLKKKISGGSFQMVEQLILGQGQSKQSFCAKYGQFLY